MASHPILKECSTKMDKALEFLKQELRGVRTGRAHPGLVEQLKVEVASYGSTMELRELATISVPDPLTLLVKPFDPGTLKDIEKGIRTSDLGISPSSDGKSIRIPIPPLSGERRQLLINQTKKMGEAQKVVVRNARRDGNKAAEAAQKAKTMSEDEAADIKDEIQKHTKKHETAIEESISAKAKEIEEV